MNNYVKSLMCITVLLATILGVGISYSSKTFAGDSEQALSKKEAQAALLNEHYMKWNDPFLFANAIKRHQFDLVDLFYLAGATTPRFVITQLIGNGDWSTVQRILNHPNRGKWSHDLKYSSLPGAVEPGSISEYIYAHEAFSGNESMLKKYIDITNKNLRRYESDCALQSKLVQELFDIKGYYRNSYTDPLVTPCIGTLETIMNSVPEKAVQYLASVNKEFFVCLTESGGNCVVDKNIFFEPNNQKYFIDSLRYLRDATQKRCGTKDEQLQNCRVVQKFDENFNRLYQQYLGARNAKVAEMQARDTEIAMKRKKNELYRNSPDSLVDSACSMLKSIKTADEMIERENKVGMESGYVNPGTLHSMGTVKVYSTEQLQRIKDEYRRKTGRQIDLTRCQ